ncbi:calpain-B-like isoform X2 [Tigriopus californicus]|uniref:calpain-B-like isoform X2 n=1 Tax=Tigriopus californicus TaxID=6832 RepID=UPI0027DAA9AE|nr:calpain-B-like isoform X2 [Tigriopus californicus]
MTLKVKKFKRQDFDKIKETYISKGKLFRDPEFPIDYQHLADTDVFTSLDDTSSPNIEWLRPKAICAKLNIEEGPKMFVGEFDRFDINQGAIGNCWLLAALANLAENKDCFNMVVPPNQSFQKGDYRGIFRFRFWVFGQWKEVVIDDRLPTLNGKLIYLTSSVKNEFWSALLEKAYAKLYGSYKALTGGLTVDAAVDFTGGIPERLEVKDFEKDPQILFSIMSKADAGGAFMGCALKNEYNDFLGLLAGHAYTLNKVMEIKCPGILGGIPLVRLRNPHGNHNEWKGDWSDGDKHWELIPKRIKRKLKLICHHDGEFYMSFRDFMKYFLSLEICHLSPKAMEGVHSEGITEFEHFQYSGEWKKDVSAPGVRDLGKRFENPQFFVQIPHFDDSSLAPVIISLYQKQKDRKTSQSIGFALYKCPPDLKQLDSKFFKRNSVMARSNSYSNLRECTKRLTLASGKYCIMPLTLEPGIESKFLLRIYVPQGRGNSHHGEFTRLVSLNSQASVEETSELYADSTDSSKISKKSEKNHVPFSKMVSKANVKNQSKVERPKSTYAWETEGDAELRLLKNIVRAMQAKE